MLLPKLIHLWYITRNRNSCGKIDTSISSLTTSSLRENGLFHCVFTCSYRTVANLLVEILIVKESYSMSWIYRFRRCVILVEVWVGLNGWSSVTWKQVLEHQRFPLESNINSIKCKERENQEGKREASTVHPNIRTAPTCVHDLWKFVSQPQDCEWVSPGQNIKWN